MQLERKNFVESDDFLNVDDWWAYSMSYIIIFQQLMMH